MRVGEVAQLFAKGVRPIYRDVVKGLLPPSIKLNAHHAVWPRAELLVIQAAWVAGANEAQVRALVVRIIEQRRNALERVGGLPLAELRALAAADAVPV